MSLKGEEMCGLVGSRARTFSNDSQLSQPSSKQNFPVLTSDSGLFSCSSNTSDCSLQLESDTGYSHSSNKSKSVQEERLQLALQDVRKLRSELERLSKSEQWYKQELRQQKSTRLDDLERIYTQERKFMQENQRLQKECVRLYEKCNELERELEKQNQESFECHVQHINDEENFQGNMLEFEKDQQLAIIKDQQQLISVLRKQKRSLLEDLRSLTEEKDEKLMEMQRLLADLEFDNKLITKKYTEVAKERLNLESDLKQSDSKLSMVLQENNNLEKSILDLKEQLEIQQRLLQLKESEIEHTQQHYTNKIQHEQDLDQVHKLSIKYQEEVNSKTLEIIRLKERLQEMQDEVQDMQNLQERNEMQQRQIDQLNFSIDAYRLELQELKASDLHKNKQLDELHTAMDKLFKDKELVCKTNVESQNEFLRVKQVLESTQQQYEHLQELYKKTQFQLELLELERGKFQFQNDRDCQEIEQLRNKLKEYLQQTTDLSNKIQEMEYELAKLLKENYQLKQHVEHLGNSGTDEKYQQIFLGKIEQNSVDLKKNNFSSEVLDHEKNCVKLLESNKSSDDPDFLKLKQQCEKLQSKLDLITGNQVHLEVEQSLYSLNEFSEEGCNENSVVSSEEDEDFLNMYLQGQKLQENLNKLKLVQKEKQNLLSHVNTSKTQISNQCVGKLVTENEILKKKDATKAESLAVLIQKDINEGTQRYAKKKEYLENHIAKVGNLQEKLLVNDGNLYKLERKLETFEEVDKSLEELKKENTNLKEQLGQEESTRNELNKQLLQETEKLEKLRQSLKELKIKQAPTQNQAVQCLLEENSMEVNELKEHILKLKEEQRWFLEKEAFNKEERLHFLQQMVDLQNNKMQNLQKHQTDWEDILTSLNNAHALEEKTRRDLELKRMELEELNQVFAEQNDELRKMEEFTALLEIKRQQEKEQLKLTFQKEINVMKQRLHECRQEVENQKLLNQQLEKRNERFQQEGYANEVAEYKNKIRELRSSVSKIMEEKETLLRCVENMEKQTKHLKDSKREAILMPDFSLNKVMGSSPNNSVGKIEVLKQNISEDHLRILTKVLEAEYQRKMLRYDEHIHSLLSNLKSLKKSLKANEEQTALLSEEQLKTKDELKDLQKAKISLEDMRLKYEQSQNIIKELTHSLAFERKRYALSDYGKSSQNNGTTYEVSNLIDDYKKLIQQSAFSTKRPSTSAILELIQRSNQYVPNLDKLEYNVEGLRSELQNFLTSCNHKIPATSLIATASLSVPPSLMDELRVASEGF